MRAPGGARRAGDPAGGGLPVVADPAGAPGAGAGGGAGGGAVAAAVGLQLFTSVLIVLANKGAVSALPFSSGLVFLQCAFTAVAIAGGRAARLAGMRFGGFSWEKGRKWLGVVVCWVLPMVFSMRALQETTVETMVVFRMVSTIFVAGGEALAFGKAISPQSAAAILLGIVAAGLYAWGDQSSGDSSAWGYFWCFMYAASLTVNALYVKKVFDSLPQMGTFEKTFYQNLMGLPLILLIALATEPVFGAGGLLPAVLGLSPAGAAVVLVSCAAGLAVSFAGTRARELLSPTSFNVLGNASKPLTVLLSMLIFNNQHSPLALLGLAGVLASSFWYGLAQQRGR